MATPKRYRHWTTVLYPESCVENWRSILDEEHIQYAVSPLHEFDTNPDGELKKAHWHIAFVFDGVKSFEQILEITQKIGAVTPQRCLNLRGLIRYFCHLDNPEKHQYFVGDIECHNGLDIDDCLRHTVAESDAILDDILDWIDETHTYNYRDLLRYVRISKPEWKPIVYHQFTIVIQAYLNSCRCEDRLERKVAKN